MRLIDADVLMMSLADWWYSSFGQEETDEAKAIRKVLDQVEEGLKTFSSEPRWIPCSAALPEDDQKVICCTVTQKGLKNIIIGYHWAGGWACGMNRNVVAWMPLPEPYREAVQDE